MEQLSRLDSQEFRSISKYSSKRKARGAIGCVGEVYRNHRLNLLPSLRLCRCLYVLVHCAELSLILTSSFFDASGMNLSDLANTGPCMTIWFGMPRNNYSRIRRQAAYSRVALSWRIIRTHPSIAVVIGTISLPLLIAHKLAKR
jgi:hypothetical protein